jgi:hypothetical protein
MAEDKERKRLCPANDSNITLRIIAAMDRRVERLSIQHLRFCV